MHGKKKSNYSEHKRIPFCAFEIYFKIRKTELNRDNPATPQKIFVTPSLSVQCLFACSQRVLKYSLTKSCQDMPKRRWSLRMSIDPHPLSPWQPEGGQCVGVGWNDGGTSGHYALYHTFLLENGPATPNLYQSA